MQLTKVLLLGTVLAAAGSVAQAECGKPERERGQQVFDTRCAICHSADRKVGHQFGPNLAGVLGRPIGKAKGYSYTPPLGAASGHWDSQALQDFLEAPSRRYPGTAMAFGGLPEAADRAAVACFLGGRK